MAATPSTIIVKSAIKGSPNVYVYQASSTIAAKTATTATTQLMSPKMYVDAKEATVLDPDSFRVTKRKSKHKVKHDVYNIEEKVFDILQQYTNIGIYPPEEVLLHISRLYQCEHVNQHLAETKVQSASTDVVAKGPKGGTYSLSSSSGRRKYI